ncbi:DUF3821 domain-containing protein [Methanoregula sp.]|uniref:DUF3821 domain-containing protein n=1 Tax=Methanoregula sp. TaxID=2052170 RepID=UPI0035618E90
MQIKRGQFSSLLLIGSLFLIGAVQGAIITVNQGNTVFIGEQGLDISAAMGPDTSIGWWASGADVRSSTPSKTINVASQLNSFAVSPSQFSGYTGTWNRLDSQGNSDGSAFIVADPQINIHVEDTTTGADVQNMNNWVPSGDVLRFRIETNLAQISSQRGAAATMTIKVQPPSGGIYNALIDASGISQSIVNIPITTTPQYTNPIWDTGNRANYAPGSYTVWAECNTNLMKDNYEQTGKTVTQKISFVNQDQNPLIGGNVQTTAQATTATTIPTTRATTIPVTSPPTIKTTLQTTVPTQPPTTVPPTAESTSPVTSVPVTPAPTKTPGFGSALAGISLIIGAIVYFKRN